MNEVSENAPGAGVESAPTSANADGIKVQTLAELQGNAFHAMAKLEGIGSIKVLVGVVRSYHRALEGQLAKVGRENAMVADALDNYWREQPDLVAAAHACMKDCNDFRIALSKCAALLGHEDQFVELPAALAAHLEARAEARAEELAAVRKLAGEALGAASMCWNPNPGGVFQSEEAVAILDQLMAELRPYLGAAPVGGEQSTVTPSP